MLEGDFPATFVWNSTTYTAIAGPESRNVEAGYGSRIAREAELWLSWRGSIMSSVALPWGYCPEPVGHWQGAPRRISGAYY